MLSIKGVVQNGMIKPLEAVPQGHTGQVVITFLDDYSGTHIPKDKKARILAQEEDAFIKMHAVLCQDYMGEYVAVHGSEMVDHDSDLESLTLRMYERFNDQPVWIAPVRQQPVEEWHMRSPRLNRQTA